MAESAKLDERTARYVLRRALHEFSRHGCTDLAAGLVYHAAFAALPALLALVSIVGLVGQADAVADGLAAFLQVLAPREDLGTVLRPTLEHLARSPAAPITFAVGVAGALWSTSNYTAAFGRAMDRVWGVEEGRSYVRMRLQLLLLTVVLLVLVAAGAVAAVLSGDVVRSLALVVGMGDVAVAVWAVLKWPLFAVIAVVVVALLYSFTPDVRTPRRWAGAGSIAALLLLAVASAGLVVYAANFDHYDDTYGAIGSVILILLWLWIANLALLLGAELDAEIERGRELERGIAAERRIVVPVIDTRASRKRDAQRERDVAEGAAIREAAVRRRDRP